jgi:hypothetical protein
MVRDIVSPFAPGSDLKSLHIGGSAHRGRAAYFRKDPKLFFRSLGSHRRLKLGNCLIKVIASAASSFARNVVVESPMCRWQHRYCAASSYWLILADIGNRTFGHPLRDVSVSVRSARRFVETDKFECPVNVRCVRVGAFSRI